MATIPFDSTVALLREGYPFISSRCEALGADLFTSRLALRPVTFLRGADAAELFYGGDRFTRAGAVPPSAKHLLQDEGSVQTLDGPVHRHRKHAFLELVGPDARQRLGDLFERSWQEAARTWPGRGRFVLHDEVSGILARTACAWAGVPLPAHEAARRTRELRLMIDNAGRFGPPNWYARARRLGTERWAAGLVERVRAGDLAAAPRTALRVFADLRGPDGAPLPASTAAVELINVLRPTVAVARFVVFAATALHEHPGWRGALAAGDEAALEAFAQEVRRHYPFFPAVPGRVREPFEWRGHRFAAGDRVVLDLYGTCHDPRLWEDPDSFRPERFRGRRWEESPRDLIAQGAGRHDEGHRCPGEWSTVELLKRAVRLLAASGLEVPPQDLSIRLNRFPALPRSGFVVEERCAPPGPGGAGTMGP
ncbi:cytochrome P450 [Kocuria sp. CPCC 205292]|uniref:cytochrome P450 n=1 Tax=Kocuria cellulosilytica TaxID=3071451 RepID=UPI0034D459A1